MKFHLTKRDSDKKRCVFGEVKSEFYAAGIHTHTHTHTHICAYTHTHSFI